ncbi:MAG: hypothetical protein AABX28_00710 [Nanoarchaeota archaeon]
MENKFMKIEYMKRKEINFDEKNTSIKARAVIEKAGQNDNLILKVSINSPVFIEDAAPLTTEGILSICKED